MKKVDNYLQQLDQAHELLEQQEKEIIKFLTDNNMPFHRVQDSIIIEGYNALIELPKLKK